MYEGRHLLLNAADIGFSNSKKFETFFSVPLILVTEVVFIKNIFPPACQLGNKFLKHSNYKYIYISIQLYHISGNIL